MKPFVVLLHSATGSERLTDVTGFVGEDESGSFGLLANHARMMTYLNFGLARLRYSSGETEYLALPGGLLYFVNNEFRVTTRQYSRSRDYDQILDILDREMAAQEDSLRSIKDSLRRLDESILKRLLALKLLDVS
jgi:F-type H+-transporting ATPase subunit epsilon